MNCYEGFVDAVGNTPLIRLNVAAAMRVAKSPGPGHMIVTVLCDSGARYQSRLFNPEWLREKGLEPPRNPLLPA